jgi:hypothetical protein
MMKFTDQYVSKIAIAVVIGGAFLAHPVYAADPAADDAAQTQSDSTQAQSGGAMDHDAGMKRVDERIKELHDTLNVTPAQEPQWRKVTHAMRENDAMIHRLVEARQENENATAVDDLKSYERIAYAHDQGLKKLIPAFDRFYNNLSPEQKTSADDMFGRYEGRVGEKENQGSATPYNQVTPSSGSNSRNENDIMNGNNATNGSGANANPSDQTNPADQPNPADQNK